MTDATATNLKIPVIVAGATGKMGRATIRAIAAAEDMVLIGATGRSHLGEDIGELVGIGPLEIPVTNDLQFPVRQAIDHALGSVVPIVALAQFHFFPIHLVAT